MRLQSLKLPLSALFNTILGLACATHSNLASAQGGNFEKADTSRVSIGTFSGATEANEANVNSQISRNGRFVVFESTATNLVNYVTVTAGRKHVYLLDRQSGTLELISINQNGAEAVGENFSPSVSADGRYVAFASTADGTQFFDVDLCDDGEHVNIFYPGTHVYVRDRLANKTFLASQITQSVEIQTGFCEGTTLGVKKVCKVTGCNLTNPAMYTLEPVMAPFTKRVSGAKDPRVPGRFAYSSPSSLNPKISGDGQYVVFDTDATNLGGLGPKYTYFQPLESQSGLCSGTGCDYTNDATSPLGGIITSGRGFPAFSRVVDNNTVRDIAVRDGKALSTTIVSFGCLFHATGVCNVQGERDSTNPQISDDGQFVSFHSTWNFLDLDFNGLKDVFLVRRDKVNDEVANLDRVSNNTSRLLAANNESLNSAMSADGRYIAFDSLASNIITNDTNGVRDVFVYDSKFFVTVRCGTTSAPQGNGASSNPSIDGSGNYISFESASTNWGATTGTKNIFVGKLIRDSIGRLSACNVELASKGDGSVGGNNSSSLSSVGTVPRTSATPGAPRLQIPAVAYQSLATNLHTGTADTNGKSDVYQAPGCSAKDLVTDTDGDGTIDCFDQCQNDPIRVTDKDTDADGYPDCEEGCDSDPQKTGPGLCGCGVLDTDSDSDGTPDCTDKCPNDPAKLEVGECGCGVADADQNQNGVIDCKESAAPTTPTPSGTPGATPNPDATPTPDGSLPQRSPGTIALTRINARSLQLTITDTLNLGASLAAYEVALERIVGNNISEKSVFTKNTSPTARNLLKGRYRARFRAVSTAGVRSKWSNYSGSFTVR